MGMDTIYFRSSEELRAWFAEHGDAQELWVGFYKKGSGETGITYPEAVDEALCAGWIDGVRYGVDDRRYRNRFTPRRPRSNWSQVNILPFVPAQRKLVGAQRQAGGHPPAAARRPDRGIGAGHADTRA